MEEYRKALNNLISKKYNIEDIQKLNELINEHEKLKEEYQKLKEINLILKVWNNGRKI
jgi:hypothetical protein